MQITTPRNGSHDRLVEIWRSGLWLQNWFSCLKAGDFFIDRDLHDVGPGRCFFCKTNVKVIPPWPGSRDQDPSFVIEGLEIVQAPTVNLPQEPKLIDNER